jgi:6,7-dimethyl-8-ribityllumazine synthase
LEQTITLSFTIEQLKVVLHGLDQVAHGASRPVIDYIVTEANRQQQELRAKIAEAESKAAEQAKAEVE